MSFVGFTDSIKITLSNHWKVNNPLNLDPGDIVTLNKVPNPTYYPLPDQNGLVYTETGTQEAALLTNRLKMSFGNKEESIFSIGLSRAIITSSASIAFYNMVLRLC